MKKDNNKNIPKNEQEYKVKYVFKEDSIVDINNVIKECFLIKLNTQKM